jgi:hypothetical protein
MRVIMAAGPASPAETSALLSTTLRRSLPWRAAAARPTATEVY